MVDVSSSVFQLYEVGSSTQKKK